MFRFLLIFVKLSVQTEKITTQTETYFMKKQSQHCFSRATQNLSYLISYIGSWDRPYNTVTPYMKSVVQPKESAKEYSIVRSMII